MVRYHKPAWPFRRVNNPVMRFLSGTLGLGIRSARVLHVRGRKTGLWRSTPVNILEHRGGRYLVAPRGQTQWARNLRVAGEARLKLGRKLEHIRVEELDDDEKVPFLREYLRRWRLESGRFFDLRPGGTDAEVGRTASDHPVFRILD